MRCRRHLRTARHDLSLFDFLAIGHRRAELLDHQRPETGIGLLKVLHQFVLALGVECAGLLHLSQHLLHRPRVDRRRSGRLRAG